MLEIARSHATSAKGPNCLASSVRRLVSTPLFAKGNANTGNPACFSVRHVFGCADWAKNKRRRFFQRHFTGSTADVTLAKFRLPDLQTTAPITSWPLCRWRIAISRRFMSVRCARCQIGPIILLTAGRHAAGSAPLQTHSGMIAGSDIVFDAAVRHAGVVRVKNVHQLTRLGHWLQFRAPTAC